LIEAGLTLSWLIGLTKSFVFWNSGARQVKEEITENGGNLEHWAKMTLKGSTRPSRRWRETRTVMELRMLEYQVDNLCGRHKWIVKTFNDNLKEFQVIE
jgi:hypothetical protein